MIYHKGNRDLNGLSDEVSKTVADLRPYKTRFDSIVVTGLSGIVVGVPAALRLKKPLVIIRKPGENSHSSFTPIVNGAKLGTRALFLDDFGSTGATRKRVARLIKPVGAQLVGDYYYRDSELWWEAA